MHGSIAVAGIARRGGIVGADGRAGVAQLLINSAQAPSTVRVERVFLIDGDPGVGDEGEGDAIGGLDLTDDDVHAGGGVPLASGLDAARRGV